MTSKKLVAASTEPLVLSVLGRGESYGYAIINQVKELSDGALEWTDGMLYPVLHRLEKRGLVASRWAQSDTGRRRRYYSLSESGQVALQRERDEWGAVNSTLSLLWGGSHA